MIREIYPFYTSSARDASGALASTLGTPQVDCLTQQRTELTNQAVDRYIREMNITNEAAKTHLRVNAKIGLDSKLYYNDIRLEKLRGTGFLSQTSLKGTGLAEFKRNVVDVPSEQAIT